MINGVAYTVVTTTGAVLAAPSSGNWFIYGYSLKGSGAVATLALADDGTATINLPALAAAGSLTPNVFPMGVKFTGAVTLTGVSTNLSGCTIFYSKI